MIAAIDRWKINPNLLPKTRAAENFSEIKSSVWIVINFDQCSVWNSSVWILSIWRRELRGAEGQLESMAAGNN